MIVNEALHWAVDLVLAASVPNPPPKPPPGMEGPVNTVIGWVKWFAIIAGLAGLLICATKMSFGRNGRSATAAEGATDIPWALAGVSVAMLSTGIVSAVIGG